MSPTEIGMKLSKMFNEGDGIAFIEQFYADDVVSMEGQDSPEMPARMEGKATIIGKNEWWEANNEIHGITVEGPFVGHRDDQFAMRFGIDATPKGGVRTPMIEVALYTVKDDKIVMEEFLYLMD